MSVDTYTTPGSFTWTAPVGVTSVVAEGWGGGGGGGDDDGATFPGGGGGGGGYARATFTVVPGIGYAVNVANGGAAGTAGAAGSPGGGVTGDTSFTVDGSNYVTGLGGAGGAGGAAGGAGGAGGAGTATGGSSTQTYTGGTGGTQSVGIAGGGGSSAGTGANGANGTAPTGGTAPSGGGNGGNGGSGVADGTAGAQPGGGGGGAGVSHAPAAGAAGKVVLTYTAVEPSAGRRISAALGTPSPPPFPGGILAVVNQFGTPPASAGVAVLRPIVASTPSPPPFPGQVVTGQQQVGPPPGPRLPVIAPAGGSEPPPFQGAVRVAAATNLGLSALPARPVIVQTPSPPPFPGGFIIGQRRAEIVRARNVAPIALDPIPFPGAVITQAPKRGTELRGQPAIVSLEPLPAFPGAVAYSHPIGLANRIAARSQTVMAALETHPEPGGAIMAYGRSTHARPPAPALVRLPDVISPPVQPTAIAGVPARPAAARGGQVAALDSAIFPGGVAIARNPFGSSPLPGARGAIARLDAPAAPEPGAAIVAFGGRRATQAIGSRTAAVVAAAEAPTFPGAVHVRVRQTSDPRVFSRSIVVGMDFAIAAMVQPFVMSGVAIGEVPPPPPVPPAAPAVGVIVTIAGSGHASLTISSSDCECC